MDPSLHRRESILERGETEWRATDEALVVTGPDGRPRSLPWERVAAVRLTYAATRLKPWRWKVEFLTVGGTRLSFDNGHFEGPGRFDDRTEAFSAVVRKAIERVADRAPDARWRLGTPPLMYWSQVVAGAMAMLLLFWILWIVPMSSFSLLIFVKLGLVALMIGPAAAWAVRSRPRRATPATLSAALPFQSAAASNSALGELR